MESGRSEVLVSIQCRIEDARDRKVRARPCPHPLLSPRHATRHCNSGKATTHSQIRQSTRDTFRPVSQTLPCSRGVFSHRDLRADFLHVARWAFEVSPSLALT